jgi:hypothetical protein
MRTRWAGLAALAAMVFAGAPRASASVAEIEVSFGGGTPVGITNPTSISHDGWTVVFVGAASNSPSYEPFDFGLDSGTFDVSCASSTCPVLQISASSTGFESAEGFFTTYSLVSEAGGTTSESAYYSTSNTLFSEGSSIGTISNPPFPGETAFTGAVPAGPYSLTIVDTFTDGSTGANFFLVNADIGAAPEPRSILLFGSGLLLLGVILRRRLFA